jgi:hypothetical protein
VSESDDKKSASRFRLEEALRESGCAVCRLVERDGRLRLDNLLYELVNDPDVQQEMRDSLGFCNQHAHRMLGMRSGLGAAILYRAVVRKLWEVLEEPPGDRASSTLKSLLGRQDTEPLFAEPGTGCMICAAEHEAEESYLRALLEAAEDTPSEELLGREGTVCAVHLGRASALAGGSLPDTLVEMARKVLEELEADLDRYVWHNDYRFRDEPWGRERDAPWRAVRWISGEKR